MSFTASSRFRIEEVPKEWASDEEFLRVVNNSKEFRLFSLRAAPNSFSSTYEQEVLFPDEKWAERLTSKDATTFVGTKLLSESTITHPDKLHDWVGTIVAIRRYPDQADISASNIAASNTSRISNTSHPQQAIQRSDVSIEHPATGTATPIYQLNGLFVHPSMRGQGLGRALINRSLAFVKEECELRRMDSAKVELKLDSDNEIACGLYSSCGFLKVGDEYYRVGKSMRHALQMSQTVDLKN